jgi:hypothetical protein
MRPIFFPQTFVAGPVLEGLLACFTPLVIYQPNPTSVPTPLVEWEKCGRIQLRAPIFGDEEELARLLADFRHWAALHADKRGALSDYVKTDRGWPPFFDETSSAQIRADIRKNSRPAATAAAARRLLRARLLLCIAQEMDLQNDSLAAHLRQAEQMEQALFGHLRGEETVLGRETAVPSAISADSTDRLLPERYRAWALLAAAATRQAGSEASGIFVTANRAAAEMIAGLRAAPVDVFRAAGIPVTGARPDGLENWRQELLDALTGLVTLEGGAAAAAEFKCPPLPSVAAAAEHVTLRVTFFSGRPTGPPLGTDEPPTGSTREEGIRNTVVAWVNHSRGVA